MKRTLFLFIVSLLLVITSCQKNAPTHFEIVDNDKKIILFFSDDEKLVNEVPYYDAFLELKTDYPDEINNLKVFTRPQDNNHYSTFDISTCPTVIVLYDDEIILHLHGEMKKNEIVEPLLEVLAKK